MKLSCFLPLAALAWAQACTIYNEGLLDEDDDGVEASGGSASGGRPSSSGGRTSTSGGAQATGGRSSGGAATGGTATSGGAGGEEPSGTGGKNSGGTASGGASTGGASTGGTSSGGTSSGGTSSGGTSSGGAPGTGGMPAVGPFLVTDMSKSTFSNSPFFGKIERYSQDGTDWDASSVSNMLVPRKTGSSDLVLQVAATFEDDLWGVDIAITLKSGQAFDLAPYKTLTFELTGIDQETPVRVGLEDYASHRSSASGAPCSSTGVGADCDKHVEALAQSVPGEDWETIELDLDAGTFDGCGLGCDREAPLDLTRVYAIHFKMDPEDAGVDFSLDNIYIDN